MVSYLYVNVYSEKRGSNSKERLQVRNKMLEERVAGLEVVAQDYGQVRRVLGSEKIDNLLKEVKENERMKMAMEREKCKFQRKNNRDER